jgi:hypothetical protein
VAELGVFYGHAACALARFAQAYAIGSTGCVIRGAAFVSPSHDQVRLDVEAWAPLVQPGGWIVIDDYVRAFVDGPRRVGDELVARGDFDCAFSWSDSPFLRKPSG